MALHALRDLLVSPRDFFESHTPGSLVLPALGVVALLAFVTVVGLWAVMQTIVPELPPEGRRAFGQVLGTVSVLIPIIIFVSWGILAGIVHLLVRNHAAAATYGRTFAVVGLGAILEIPATLLGFVSAYRLFESVSFSNPEAAQQQIEAATSGDGPLMLLVWVGVTLWQGYIWREGLLGAYDLSVDRATVAAAAAVVISLLMVFLG